MYAILVTARLLAVHDRYLIQISCKQRSTKIILLRTHIICYEFIVNALFLYHYIRGLNRHKILFSHFAKPRIVETILQYCYIIMCGMFRILLPILTVGFVHRSFRIMFSNRFVFSNAMTCIYAIID